MQLRATRDRLGDESGVALTLIVVMMASILLVAGFVIEVGNWFEHRRHLQMQVDSGALAAGTAFSGCFLDPTQTNDRIEATAHRYAGNTQYPAVFSNLFPSEAVPDGPYNLQVDDPTRVQFSLNAGAYPPGATDFAEGEPCDTRYLDVRANDIDIPAFFAGILPDGVDFVNVKARAEVEIRKVKKLAGFLPWAVPEQNPYDVLAIFVDEGTGAVRGVSPLVKGTVQNLNGEAVSTWGGLGAFTGHSQSGTGVVIATSRLPAGTVSTSGTLAEICAQAPGRVACYSGSSATSGLWYVQGFTNGTGTQAAPQLGPVNLGTASCGDDSAPYFLLHGGCAVAVNAKVDFGTSDPTAYPTCARVSANGTPLTYSGDTWTGNVSVADLSGRTVVNLSWRTGRTGSGTSCNNTSNANGTFGKVAAPYAADDASGPVNYLLVQPAGAGTPLGSLGTSSNSQHTVYVTVGLEPPLRVANPGEPPILLRFASKSGSLNQALDCDAAPRNLPEEVSEGCKTFYAVNERGEVCSGAGGPTWDQSSLPPATFEPDPVPDCIQAKTGDVTSMAQGLADRFEAPCTPNNWAAYRQNGELPPDDDPRWVTLIITNYSGFSGQGARVVPVRVFAGFYVTGYFHQQTARGCGDDPNTPVVDGDDPHPNGVNPSSNRAKGDVWGYFVTSVILDLNAESSDELCAFYELGVCTAVLTR